MLDTGMPTQPAPGWVFTPSVRFAATHDDNVTLRLNNDVPVSDYVTTISPRADLDYNGRRVRLDLNYGGSILRYRDLTELDAFDQHAIGELRYRTTKHTTLFVRNSFTKSPTTDAVTFAQPGIPFARIGSRIIETHAGLEAQLTRRLSLDGGYEFESLQFGDESALNPLFQGGHLHGANVSSRYQLTETVAVGGDFAARHTVVASGTQPFDIYDGSGTLEVKLTPSVTATGSAGI
jgi:hypothetical protein